MVPIPQRGRGHGTPCGALLCSLCLVGHIQMPIPVNIITGVLGVGKTTAIRHLLSQRPPHERWAIVVNEFGALGIDGAVLDTAGGLVTAGDAAGDGGVTVREVAGGCLCCAVSAPFTVAVTQVLRRAKPDRLFIEPSGMGHPGGLFDVLSGEHLGKTLELRATIALVDMTEARAPRLRICTTRCVRFDNHVYTRLLPTRLQLFNAFR